MRRNLALLALSLCFGCTRPERVDVLLVTVDTLRADHVGAYGHDRDTTPTLDALAAEGALFEVVYAPVGSTAPSHATIFTGRHPLSHGVTANGMTLAEEELTLAELLAARGWTTAAFVSALTASTRWGLGQGFAFVDETLTVSSSAGGPPAYRSPREAVDAALAWLDEQPAQGPPVFLWLHLFDPHSPWEPPPEHAALFPPRGSAAHAEDRAAYEAEVHYSDAELGRLLHRFEQRPGEALVVATSDHGEGLWDHGWATHSRTTHEEELRVPWILRWSERLPAGRRIASPPVELADLAPTLTGLLGLDDVPPFEGRDLSELLLGRAATIEGRELLLMRPLHEDGRAPRGLAGPGFGLRSGPLKVFSAPLEERLELFDVEADPHERHDLAREREQEAEGLARRAFEQGAALRGGARPRVPSALSEDELQALRSLGYLR